MYLVIGGDSDRIRRLRGSEETASDRPAFCSGSIGKCGDEWPNGSRELELGRIFRAPPSCRRLWIWGAPRRGIVLLPARGLYLSDAASCGHRKHAAADADRGVCGEEKFLTQFFCPLMDGHQRVCPCYRTPFLCIAVMHCLPCFPHSLTVTALTVLPLYRRHTHVEHEDRGRAPLPFSEYLTGASQVTQQAEV